MPSIYFSSGHIQYGHTCSLAHKATSARFLLFWRESEKSVEDPILSRVDFGQFFVLFDRK